MRKDMVVDGKDTVVDGKGTVVDGKDMVVDENRIVHDGQGTVVDEDTFNRTIVLEDTETEPVAMDVDDEIIRNSEEEGHRLSSPTKCGSSIVNAHGHTAFRGVEEGKAPLWVKWRGKWRAGVQCSLEDCPAQTVQAMPTYGRKSYILVFFPKSRSFIWTDWQLTCCISENPQPLSFGSHKSGRNSVLGLNIAKSFMLRKIATSMLDISDQLPVTAVEECARNVRFWKEVANEAEKTSTYQELGTMLVKLKSMILSSVIEETWNNARVQEWEHECKKADSAGSLEMLVKELKNAVCWDEVDKLWGEYEQENLVSEWQSLKKRFSHNPSHQEKSRCSSFRRKTFDASVSSPEGSDEHGGSGNGGNTESEQDNKRLKLVQGDVPGSHKGMSMDLEMEKNVSIASSLDIINKTPSFGSKLLNSKRDVEANPESKSSRCLAFSKRRKRQCNRYAKGGAVYCYKHIPSTNKEPSGGYTNEEKNGKLPMLDKLPVSNIGEVSGDAGVCSGITKYGRRCRHKARDGSVFCSMHTLHDLEKIGKMLAIEKSVIHLTKSRTVESKLPTSVEHIIAHPKEKIEKMDVEQADSPIQEASKCVPKSTRRNKNTERCIGWCGTGAQCSHRARIGSSYCEKHIPGSSPYSQRGQEKTQCKEISGKTPNNEKDVNMSLLMNLTDDYVRARLSNTESRSSKHSMSNQQMIDMVLKEVSGSLEASEALYDLVSTEMEGLKKCVEEKDFSQVQNFLVPCLKGSVNQTTCPTRTIGEKECMEEKDLSQMHNTLVPSLTGAINHTNSPMMTTDEENHVEKKDELQVQNYLDPFLGEVKSAEHLSKAELLKQISSAPDGHYGRYRCKLCTQVFIDLIVLGEHWRECHNKEAQQYFRGYSCQYCSQPFRNKKGLYRHRKAHHAEMVSQTKSSLIATCKVCNGHFVKFENLWQHVICSHPQQLFAFWPTIDPSVGSINGFFQWQPSGSEIANADKNPEKSVEEPHEDIDIADNKVSASEVVADKVVGTEAKKVTVVEEMEQASSVEETATQLSIIQKTANQHFFVEDATKQLSAVEEIVKQPYVEESTNRLSIVDKTTVTEQISVVAKTAKQSSVKENTKKLFVLEETVKQSSVEESTKQPSAVEEAAKQHSAIKESGKLTSCNLTNELKFKCKLCGLRFPLLPDLGRHHQAEHKPTHTKNITEKSAFMAASQDLKPFIGLEKEKEKRKPQKLHIRRAPPNGKANTEVHTDIEDERKRSMVKSEGYTGTMFEGLLDNQSLENKSDGNRISDGTISCVREKSCHKMILCEDLSFGKERIPIPCVLDSNEMGTCTCSVCADNPNDHLETLTPWLQFNYATKRTLNLSLGLDTEPSHLGCCCQGNQCLPTKCEHVYVVDNENSDIENMHGKSMIARFPYDDRGRMSLEEGHLVYECNSLCNCSEDCPNRVLQKGVHVKLEVYKTRHKGWAVRAGEHIARGTFICEYIGEVIDGLEADRRGERYGKERCSYLYDVKARVDIRCTGRSNQIFIDATEFGNVSRFINHSCSPNLVNYQVLVESIDCRLAHIGLYAARDIQIGEELAYDYCYEISSGKGTPCHCGAKDCRGRLY